MSLRDLREMSNRYGGDPRYVLAGGGNTSWKNDTVLYVKGSGIALAVIQEEQFVALDRGKLNAIWNKSYSVDFDTREAEALADLMAARLSGEVGRPSVETLMHDILPFEYVCHLHPGLVNAMTCAINGKSAAARLFPGALWVDAIMPGYVLAATMKRQLDEAVNRGAIPDTIFIENHGIFIGGNSIEDIDLRYAAVMNILEEELVVPEHTLADADPRVELIAPALRMMLWEGDASYLRYAPLRFASSEEMQRGLLLALSPDHVVYCGSEALFVSGGETMDILSALPADIAAYKARTGLLPRVIVVGDVGVFASGNTIASCDTAYDLMLNAVFVCREADNFGGSKPMPRDLLRAMGNWEVEHYRKAKVLHTNHGGAMGKIALVTGAAQGFGLGIAQELCKAGAVVGLADLNLPGARQAAKDIQAMHGTGCALAVECDVTDETSVAVMVRECVLRYGGLDVLVSNAGIVCAGALEELSLKDFELSTKVNYTAFFLCAKAATKIMRAQRTIRPDYMMDIIQINSKSGLSGSNKNFAYAGSKFGGIGLVQSFALELATDGIKVNAICPGNFLEGPLWSDPEHGLFIQYLKTSKVPGAKTIDDVRRYYESRVPLGRGCRVADVVRAILYIMSQEYETGNALPVTGGQEMLH